LFGIKKIFLRVFHYLLAASDSNQGCKNGRKLSLHKTI
jgi:hypothetical protein